MRKQTSWQPLLLAIIVLIFAGLGCGRFTPGGGTPAGNAPANSSGNSAPGNNAANTAANKPAANTGGTSKAQPDIAGTYSVSGTNVNGQGKYEGTLTITKRGDVYQFSWDVAGSKYDGVGVQTDDAVSVSYTEGANGQGCGVALYRINSDGSLSGKAGYWGVNESETENAVRTAGNDFAGEYEATGTNPQGKEYKNKLTIAPSGPGFSFSWKGTNSLDGMGVRQGNFATAGFGGKQCSFVAYQVLPDGSLDGKWGGLGTVTFGTEKALKK